MRYDIPVYFGRVIEGVYNQETGDYGKAQIKETKVFASVTGTRTETMTLVYGAIKQGSVTLQLQNAYTEPFDQIRIGEKIYQMDDMRKLRTKQVFVLSEVQ